ncbi:hypothetical protein HY792_06890 [Candidatus Desantisbacteria bacterium]|nr:hypothetical protein [Candidatus Desantisbacteria bacterium]
MTIYAEGSEGIAVTVTVNQLVGTDTGMVDGGGIAMSQTNVFGVSFSLYAGFLKSDPIPIGELKYLDRQTRDLYKSMFINSLYISGKEAIIKGECTKNDVLGYTFEMRLTDAMPDTLSIEIKDRNGILIHTFSGELTTGDIKIY